MSKIAKTTIVLMRCTIIVKVLGFGRELVLDLDYETSMYSNAYLTAMNISIAIFAIIDTTLATDFIPIYFEVDNNLREQKSHRFVNNILNIFIVLCILLVLLGVIFV